MSVSRASTPPPCPQTPSASLATPPPTASKRRFQDLKPQNPAAGGLQPRKTQKKSIKQHVLAFVDEDTSDSGYDSTSSIRAATVAEDGKVIKQEENLKPSVQFRATVEKKLDAMKVTKTHILHGLQNRLRAYAAVRDRQLDLEASRDRKRRQLNAWDRRYSKIQGLEEALEHRTIQQVFRVPSGQEETAPVVLWKADVRRKLEWTRMMKERAFAAWIEDMKRVKDGERVMKAHMEMVRRSGEKVDGWRLRMEEAESLLKMLQKKEVEELWE